MWPGPVLLLSNRSMRARVLGPLATLLVFGATAGFGFPAAPPDFLLFANRVAVGVAFLFAFASTFAAARAAATRAAGDCSFASCAALSCATRAGTLINFFGTVLFGFGFGCTFEAVAGFAFADDGPSLEVGVLACRFPLPLPPDPDDRVVALLAAADEREARNVEVAEINGEEEEEAEEEEAEAEGDVTLFESGVPDGVLDANGDDFLIGVFAMANFRCSSAT